MKIYMKPTVISISNKETKETLSSLERKQFDVYDVNRITLEEFVEKCMSCGLDITIANPGSNKIIIQFEIIVQFEHPVKSPQNAQ